MKPSKRKHSGTLYEVITGERPPGRPRGSTTTGRGITAGGKQLGLSLSPDEMDALQARARRDKCSAQQVLRAHIATLGREDKG